VERAVTVCVIDPAAPNGIRMQTATFREQQRDTVVDVSGQRRPLREALPNVMVARNAPFVVQGEPLTVTFGRETVRFLPYQSARQIEGTRLVYLGNINGFPVYADRDEVADAVERINTARAGRTDVELGRLLAGPANRQAREVVTGASFLYVPLDPIGCVFQPIQRQEDVRKGKE
jgi:hypothetical protein